VALRVPRQIEDAISSGVWHSPNWDDLRPILGLPEDACQLTLFSDRTHMFHVMNLVKKNYLEPWFFMVEKSSEITSSNQLVWEECIFIGGNVIPGDDIFLVIDLRQSDDRLDVLWDYSSGPGPSVWRKLVTLDALLEGLTSIRHRRST
jgi:hypothetical protein